MRQTLFPVLLLLLALAGCRKNDDPIVEAPGYRLVVNNTFNLLQAEVAVYLSDESGAVRAFRWMPSLDTAHLVVREAEAGQRFDVTVVRISNLEAPGTGVVDTTVNITTYSALASGETLQLRNLEYRQATDLFLSFTNITTLDTIIVPDALTFIRPNQFNNFSGQYRVLHTGQFWIRFKADGDPFWRFFRFDNVSGPVMNVSLDPNLLSHMLAPIPSIGLPFAAPWSYQIYGVIDTAALEFLALGDLIRAPGGATPVLSKLEVIEPIATDLVDSIPIPYHSFRVRLSGRSPAADGYTFLHDGFYDQLPAELDEPDFDLEPTLLTGNRLAAVRCIGDFDVLAVSRTHGGLPNLSWEVFLPPADGIVTQRLPDIPNELGARFPDLRNYNFGGGVRARAEHYDGLSDYEAVTRIRLRADDPLWQPRYRFTGVEKNF